MAHVTFAGQVRRARERWTAALLAAGVILVLWDPAVAADAALKFLLKKGIITQSEYDEAIRDAERAPGGSQPPVVPDTSTGQPAAAKPSEAQQPTAKADPAKTPDSDTTVDLGKGIKFGYDRGIYTQFKDTFRLKIRLRIQPRFTDSHFNTAYNTIGDSKNFPLVSSTGAITPLKHGESVDVFGVHRVRLVFEGFAFNPETEYFVQFRSDTNDATTQQGGSRSTAQLYDAYLTLKQIPWANLRIGQFRTHFGRQEFQSSAFLQFVDRNFVAEAFVPNVIDRRDQGVTFFSDQTKYPINYAMGVFNGVGININRLGLNTPGNANELMYVGRITADLLGKPGYPEGDLKNSQTPQLAVGASYGYNAGLQTNTSTLTAGVNNQISTAIASLGNGRLLNQGVVNIGTTGLDFVFKYKGLSLQAEGFVRNVDTRESAHRVGNATGYYVQGGYFLIPTKLEVVGRYGSMDPDTQLGHDMITSTVGGLNWYFNGHENKLQFDYGVITTRLGGADVGGNVSLIENRARLQYTIVF